MGDVRENEVNPTPAAAGRGQQNEPNPTHRRDTEALAPQPASIGSRASHRVAASVEFPATSAPPTEDDPFTRAALRTRQAVQPQGGRREGAATRVLENCVPHVLGGVATLPQRAFDASEQLHQTGEYDPAPAVEPASQRGAVVCSCRIAYKDLLQQLAVHQEAGAVEIHVSSGLRQNASVER